MKKNYATPEQCRTQQKQTKGTKQGSDGNIILGPGAQAPNGAANFVPRSEAKPLFHRFVYLVPFCSN